MRWGNLFFILGLLTACKSDYHISDLVVDAPDAPPVVETTIPDRDPPLIVNTETDPEPPELTAEIEVTPVFHEFGDTLLECPMELMIEIKSVGGLDLIVDKLHYSGPDDLAMNVDYLAYGGLPWILVPGASAFISVEYMPNEEDYHLGYVTVDSNDLTDPSVIIGQDGEGIRGGDVTDEFIQEEQVMLDILFVIDNSCSMSDEQTELASNADLFINPLSISGADFHIGVITTDSTMLRGNVMTPTSPSLLLDFQNAIVAGTSGNATEKGLQMARDALLPGGTAGLGSVFFREAANLAVIIVSDEDDFSLDPVTNYVSDMMATKSSGTLFSLHSVAGLYPSSSCADPAERYDEAVFLSSGQFFDICTSDWGYQVEQLAEDSLVPILQYLLSDDPIVDSIEVYIDGLLMTEGWYYDPSTNSINFDVDYAPPADSLIEVDYGIYGECP